MLVHDRTWMPMRQYRRNSVCCPYNIPRLHGTVRGGLFDLEATPKNENRSIKQSVIRNPEMAVHRDWATATFRNSEFEATFRGAQFPRACAIVLTLRFPKTEAKRRRSARWDASIVCS
jgi:hypothetical protein